MEPEPPDLANGGQMPMSPQALLTFINNLTTVTLGAPSSLFSFAESNVQQALMKFISDPATSALYIKKLANRDVGQYRLERIL